MRHRANILIIDDEIGPRESLKMVLKPFYNVFTAVNGEQALQLVKTKPIDLVTLDLKMPGPNGTETLKEIKNIRAHVEVIIITGFGSLKTAMESIRHGAADYLLKPFDVSELMSIISRIMRKKKINDRMRMYFSRTENQSDPYPRAS